MRKRKSRRYEKRKGIPTEAEIVEGELDTPASLEPLWNIYRLGKKEEHLWMAELETPITITGAAVAYNYLMDFNFTITRITFYQEDAAGEESIDAITLRANLLFPNKTPSILYMETAVIWLGGELTLTGKRYSPVAEFQIVASGEPGNLLHVNIEFEVHGIA